MGLVGILTLGDLGLIVDSGLSNDTLIVTFKRRGYQITNLMNERFEIFAETINTNASALKMSWLYPCGNDKCTPEENSTQTTFDAVINAMMCPDPDRDRPFLAPTGAQGLKMCVCASVRDIMLQKA